MGPLYHTKMKLTLTQLTRFTKDKQGNDLKTKDGRSYTRLLIRCQEYGDKAISGFENSETREWKEGDIVEAVVEQKGEYLNFYVPKKEDKIASELSEIKTKLGKIDYKLDTLLERTESFARTSLGTKVPDFSEVDEIPPEDIPFP